MATPAPARPRPGGGRIFVILGLFLALVAAGLVYLLGSSGGGGGVVGGGTSSVVVAARDIAIRSQLGPDDVVLNTHYASTDVPPGAFTATADITKQKLFAELSIAKGQPITANMLARSPDLIAGSQPAYLPIPTGFVAITVPTSEQQGVAGNIHPGDYITIIASASVTVFTVSGAATGPPRQTSKTVFIQVHVLTVGAATNVVQPAGGGASAPPPAQSTASASSLTLVMSQCDAEFLNWFLINTTLKYTLESFHDYKPSDTTPDPTCASVEAAGGVSNVLVDKRYKFSSL